MFELILERVAVVVFIAFAAEQFIEFISPLIDPLLEWLQKITKLPGGWWKRLFAMAVIGAFVGLTQRNLFEGLFPSELAGRIVSVLVGSGGSQLVHGIFKRLGQRPEDVTITMMAVDDV